MDVNKILESIVKIKIRKDCSHYFTLKELNAYASIYNMPIEKLCKDILKITSKQLNSLMRCECSKIGSVEYKNKKENFIKENETLYRLNIVKEKIKYSHSASFTLDEIENLALKLGINKKELLSNVLKVHRNVLSRLNNETYKTFVSKEYEEDKAKYFKNINNDILKEIVYLKMKNDSSNKFNYIDAMQYANKYEINVCDFLIEILGLERQFVLKKIKSISEIDTFYSKKYKELKMQIINDVSEKILTEIAEERIKDTSSIMFSKKEIEEFSKKYGINIKDFIVYIFGEAPNAFFDMKKEKNKSIKSKKYKIKKEEVISKKGEDFISNLNLNTKNYFMLEDLKEIANNLEITIYDLIVNVMKKNVQQYYALKSRYRNNTRISIGNYIGGPLTREYCEKNKDEIFHIVEVAVKSAMRFKLNRVPINYRNIINYNDLYQDAIGFLINNGNYVGSDGKWAINSSKYEARHGGMFFRRTYYYTLSGIRKYIKERKYDVSLIDNEFYEKHISNDIESDLNKGKKEINILIDDIANNEIDRYILHFFSENEFSEETCQKACLKFKIDTQYIEDLFKHIRENYSLEFIVDEDEKTVGFIEENDYKEEFYRD